MERDAILINGEVFERQEFIVPPGTKWLPSDMPVIVRVEPYDAIPSDI